MTAVPAADATLRLLRHLSRTGPLPAAALAAALDLPRSTTYHLLTVLTEHGFVVHLPEERRYGLGLSAFELGSAYSRQAPLARAARPVLARLVDQVGESAHLAVLHGRDVLYVVEERAAGRPSLVTDVGVRLPAHLTASGRAILARPAVGRRARRRRPSRPRSSLPDAGSTASPRCPLVVSTGWLYDRAVHYRATELALAGGSHDRQAPDFVVSADGHILEPTDLFSTRLPKHLRDRAVWEEDFEIEPLVEDGARVFRRLHTPGFEGWTISRYRQTGGRTPEGDPEIILEDLALDGVDAAVMHPNLSLFGLYSDDHELSMAHARVYNDYIVERFAPYFDRIAPTAPVPITDIDDAVVEIERVAAAGFRAILLPATPPIPYYSRDLDPVWAAAVANGVQPFFHTQTGGVKVNDPASTTLRVVMEQAKQVNQPMTEKSASKRMITQAVYSPIVPSQLICELIGGGVAERYPDAPLLVDRVQRALAGVAGRRHGQVLGHRHRPGPRLVARDLGRHPAAHRPAQHGAAVPPQRQVAVPAHAERVRAAPVPRLVPGRSGGGRVPAHHRRVEHRVGQRLPARRRDVPRQPGADRRGCSATSPPTSKAAMIGGTLGGLLGFEAPVPVPEPSRSSVELPIPRMKMSANGFATSRADTRPPALSHR